LPRIDWKSFIFSVTCRPVLRSFSAAGGRLGRAARRAFSAASW
jgi:hypothetical protein